MNLYQPAPLDASFRVIPAVFFSLMLHLILLLLLRDITLFTIDPPTPEKKELKILVKLNQDLQKSRTFIDTPDQMRAKEKPKEDTAFIGNKTTRAADLSRKDTLPDDKAHVENGTFIPSVQADGNQPSMDDLAPLIPGLAPIDTLMPKQNNVAQQQSSNKMPDDIELQLPSTPKLVALKGTQKMSKKRDPQEHSKKEAPKVEIVKVPKAVLDQQLKQMDAPPTIKRSSPGQQNRMTHALERDMATYHMLEDKYGEYYKKVKRTIDVVWYSWWLRNKDISIGIRHKPAILARCIIAPTGEIKDLTVFVSRDQDQFAANVSMDVLKDAAPFNPFPDYIEEGELPLYFNFHF